MHLKHHMHSAVLADLWDDMIEASLDNLQLSLDQNFGSSEVHLVVRV